MCIGVLVCMSVYTVLRFRSHVYFDHSVCSRSISCVDEHPATESFG